MVGELQKDRQDFLTTIRRGKRMVFLEEAGERRRHQRYLPSTEFYAVAAKSVGRILDIGSGGLAFSYVRLQDTPLASDRLDILFEGDHLLRDIPVQSLTEHRLENKFATSRVEVRRCRVAFGSLTDDQRRQVAALIEAHTRKPAAPVLAPPATG
jgi:hypothetical protein